VFAFAFATSISLETNPSRDNALLPLLPESSFLIIPEAWKSSSHFRDHKLGGRGKNRRVFLREQRQTFRWVFVSDRSIQVTDVVGVPQYSTRIENIRVFGDRRLANPPQLCQKGFPSSQGTHFYTNGVTI